jgi:hypothetical protein
MGPATFAGPFVALVGVICSAYTSNIPPRPQVVNPHRRKKTEKSEKTIVDRAGLLVYAINASREPDPKEVIQMSLGANLRTLRTLHGKTLRQVAEVTGTSLKNVHRYEKGETPPSAYLEKFQAAFFIEPGALLRLGEVVKN